MFFVNKISFLQRTAVIDRFVTKDVIYFYAQAKQCNLTQLSYTRSTKFHHISCCLGSVVTGIVPCEPAIAHCTFARVSLISARGPKPFRNFTYFSLRMYKG